MTGPTCCVGVTPIPPFPPGPLLPPGPLITCEFRKQAASGIGFSYDYCAISGPNEGINTAADRETTGKQKGKCRQINGKPAKLGHECIQNDFPLFVG